MIMIRFIFLCLGYYGLLHCGQIMGLNGTLNGESFPWLVVGVMALLVRDILDLDKR